jgi:hypothetical protein
MQSSSQSGSHLNLAETQSARCIDGRAWSELQLIVRSFRSALMRGERPEIEVFARSQHVDRRTVLVELIHEELEFRIKAGMRSI